MRSLGEAGEIEPETEGMLISYNIDTSEFSEEVFIMLIIVMKATSVFMLKLISTVGLVSTFMLSNSHAGCILIFIQ